MNSQKDLLKEKSKSCVVVYRKQDNLDSNALSNSNIHYK